MIITRRKFFSFFGAGVVMAAAPKMILPGDDSWYMKLPGEYITPGYGKGYSEAVSFMAYLDKHTRRIILGHADKIFHGFVLKGDR